MSFVQRRIEQINSVPPQSGSTVWGTLTALVGAYLIFFHEVSVLHGPFPSLEVCALTVSFILTAEALTALGRIVNDQGIRLRPGRMQWSDIVYAGSINAFIARCVTIALVVIALFRFNSLSLARKLPGIVGYFLLFAALIITVTLSFVRYPVAPSIRSRRQGKVWNGAIAISMVVQVFFLWPLSSFTGQLEASIWTMSGALAASIILLNTLAMYRGQDIRVQELLRIHDDVFYGITSPSEGSNRAMLLLEGPDYFDSVKEEVKALDLTLANIRVIMAPVVLGIDAIDVIKRDEKNSPGENQTTKQAVKNLVSVYLGYEQLVNGLIKKFGDQFQALSKRTNTIAGTGLDINREFNLLKAHFTERINEIDVLNAEITAKTIALAMDFKVPIEAPTSGSTPDR